MSVVRTVVTLPHVIVESIPLHVDAGNGARGGSAGETPRRALSWLLRLPEPLPYGERRACTAVPATSFAPPGASLCAACSACLGAVPRSTCSSVSKPVCVCL